MRVLLFSGGVESTALAYQHRPDQMVTIDYGQRPAPGEVRAARHIAGELDLPHDVVTADIGALGAGDMAGRAEAPHSAVTEAWPFRNQFLVTVAAMAYADRGLREIMIGTVASDRVHADGTPAFLQAIDTLIRCELPGARVAAPAIDMDTATLIRATGVPEELLRWTFSCHRSGTACGHCRGCHKTLELFDTLGLGVDYDDGAQVGSAPRSTSIQGLFGGNPAAWRITSSNRTGSGSHGRHRS